MKAPAKRDDDRKANRRGAARLAAVQALYQMEVADKGLKDIIAEFEAHWIGQEVEGVLQKVALRISDFDGAVQPEKTLLQPIEIHHALRAVAELWW